MTEELAGVPGEEPGKAIPAARDEWQSQWLVIAMVAMLSWSVGLVVFEVVGMQGPPRWFLASLAASVGFAVVVWRLRAATAGAAAIGAAICLQALMLQRTGMRWTRTGMPELLALFLLTFGATRYARARRVPVATEREARRGRNAAQIVANLGAAGIWLGSLDPYGFAMGLAALAEATADTVSSEMGQALGGRTYLLTDWRRVRPGTDGGMSVAGTMMGVLAAGAVAALAFALGAVDGAAAAAVFVGGCSGLVFDSLLGATLERRGWLGNDWVNFISTVFAALATGLLMKFLEPPLPYW